VFEVLRDLERYPEWWPEVRQVSRGDGPEVDMMARSLLPYELRFTTKEGTVDAVAGVIEGLLSGDLEGFSRWTITADGSGSRLTYDQEVVTHKRLLDVLAPVARPFFKANHTLMMRHGEAGLRTFLAGYRMGRGSRDTSA
jgi:hypothetical protein